MSSLAEKTVVVVSEGGGVGGGATNLSVIKSATSNTITSSSGTNAALVAADGTNAGLFLPAEKTKLAEIALNATANPNTDSLPEGSTNLYHTVARVLASALTGLSIATNSAVVATDSILGGIGKLQAQVTARASLSVQNVFTALNRFKQTTCPFTTLTWASTIAPDLAQGQAFVVTAQGATTLGVPTNADGTNFQSFQLEFIQDATGSRTLAFNTTAYEFSGTAFPSVTATANAKTVLLFNRQSNGKYAVSALLDVRST
jgi:hypothetical protein